MPHPTDKVSLDVLREMALHLFFSLRPAFHADSKVCVKQWRFANHLATVRHNDWQPRSFLVSRERSIVSFPNYRQP